MSRECVVVVVVVARAATGTLLLKSMTAKMKILGPKLLGIS